MSKETGLEVGLSTLLNMLEPSREKLSDPSYRESFLRNIGEYGYDNFTKIVEFAIDAIIS